MMADRAGRLLILKHYIISDGYYLPSGRTLYLKVLLSPRHRTVSDAAFIKGRIGTNYPVDRARAGKYGGAFSALIAGCAFTFVTYKHFYQACVYSWDVQICRGDYPYHPLWVSLHVCYSSSSGTTPSGRGSPAFTLICFNPYRREIPQRILTHIRTRKCSRRADKHSITEVSGPEPIRNGGELELGEKNTVLGVETIHKVVDTRRLDQHRLEDFPEFLTNEYRGSLRFSLTRLNDLQARRMVTLMCFRSAITVIGTYAVLDTLV